MLLTKHPKRRRELWSGRPGRARHFWLPSKPDRKKIRRFPLNAPLIGRNVRKGVLARFHYAITDEVNADSIRMLYVRHARQSPPDSERRR